MNIVKYINRINDLYGNESTPKRFDTTQWLASRNQPAAVLPEEFDELSPKEELYYQKPPFSTNEVFLGSKGGVSQLVDHGPSGVRQGYAKVPISERSKELKHYHKTYEIPSYELNIGGKKVNVDIKNVKPKTVNAYEEAINTLLKWEKNPTASNWAELFRDQKDVQRNLRLYFQGKNIPETSKQILDAVKAKKLIKPDNAKIVKNYTIEYFKKVRPMFGATGEAAIVNRARIDQNILDMRKIFAKNPNAGIEELAKSIFKDFNKANNITKVDYLQQTADSVKEFSKTLLDQREVKGFRVMPKAKDIIKYIDSNTDLYGRFREGTIRDYKFAVKDSLLKVSNPTQTSAILRRNIAAPSKLRVIDEAVGLSATFKNAPGYTEATQFLKNKTNKLKMTKIDLPFRDAFDAALEGDFTLAKKYNKAAKEFIKNNPKVDVPLFEIGKKPTDTVKHFSKYSSNAQKDMLRIANKHGFALKVNSLPLSGEKGLASMYKIAKKLKGKAKLAAYTALGLTTAGAAMADTNFIESTADESIKTAIEHPWLTGAGATGAAATTKGGRNILGKAFRTLGTPLAGLGWAGWTAYDNLKSGKSLTESVVDPLVGMELTFPSMFKENLSKITKSPTLQKVLGLGKFGSRFIPGVGIAITLGSLSRDSVIAINKEAKRIDAIEDPDQQAEEQEIFIRNIKGYAGGGLANLTRTVAPDSGPVSRGLRSLYIDDMD